VLVVGHMIPQKIVLMITIMAEQLFFLQLVVVTANLMPLFVQGAIVCIMVEVSIVKIVGKSVTSMSKKRNVTKLTCQNL
jgi:hypothetical protein